MYRCHAAGVMGRGLWENHFVLVTAQTTCLFVMALFLHSQLSSRATEATAPPLNTERPLRLRYLRAMQFLMFAFLAENLQSIFYPPLCIPNSFFYSSELMGPASPCCPSFW